MTLVIAGYEQSKAIDYSKYGKTDSNDLPRMHVDGIFVVSDSAITSQKGTRTLLNGFRKVHLIEAKLWKPYFMPDGSFREYNQIYEARELFVGFAGSTLAAQHIINSISEHLGNLRISYLRDLATEAIQYNVIRHCQNNPLESSGHWDEDTFLNSDFQNLLTGEVIASNIEFSMNEALLSAGKYKLDIEEFRAMHTELVAGVWCPNKNRHELYLFRMLSKPDESGVLIAYTEKQLLNENEIAVLGMRHQFEKNAQEEYLRALASFLSPSDVMFKFLNDAIDSVQNNGSKEIDRPASLRLLNKFKVRRKV